MLKKIIKMQELKNGYKKPIKEILAASSLAYLLSPFRSKRLFVKIIWSSNQKNIRSKIRITI